MTTGTFSILPTDNVTIELYRDDVMVLSSENVKNSENVPANEGEQTNIVFDLSRNNIALTFQTGVLLFSMLQSDNLPSIFLYAIGAHSDCSECAPLFCKYAILSDSPTTHF